MTIKVEVIVKDGFTHDKRRYFEGDILTESFTVGEYFCKAGWCRDISGAVPTGEINSLDITLIAHDLEQTNQIPEVI